MSFENLLPERDGAVTISPITLAHRVNALHPTVNESGRVVRAVPRTAAANVDGNPAR